MTVNEALEQMRQKHRERIETIRNEVISLLTDNPDVRAPISIAQLVMLEEAGFVLNFETGEVERCPND